MEAVAASDRYRAGDLEAEAEYYRIHYRVTLREPEHVEHVVGRLRTHFTKAGVLTARAIEKRLYHETCSVDRYDLVPRLQPHDIPTFVLHGHEDFVPVALVARIAEAMLRGRLAVLEQCGHFAYLEAPDAVHEQVVKLFEES
jgi:pimeloyl-ACP methyl ester carboxylesterase